MIAVRHLQPPLRSATDGVAAPDQWLAVTPPERERVSFLPLAPVWL